MKKDLKQNLLFLFFIGVLILICRFLDHIPDGLQTADLYFFKIQNTPPEDGGFDDLSIVYYVARMKVIIILICIVWYATSTYWWRFVILIPTIIEIYKLVEALDLSNGAIDETNFINSLPFTLPLIIVFFVIIYKEKKFLNSRLLMRSVNREIKSSVSELASQKEILEIKDELAELKSRKNALSSAEYVLALNVLKTKLNSLYR